MPEPAPLVAALLNRLADLVGKPVLAHLVAADGAIAVVHGDLTSVDSADDSAHLRFGRLVQGVRVIVPTGLLSDVAPSREDPLRLVLRLPGSRVELKDMSPAARVEHWAARLAEASTRRDPRSRAGELRLLAAMIDGERQASSDAWLRAALQELLDELQTIDAWPLHDADDGEGEATDRDPDDEQWEW